MEGGERCAFSSWKYRHYFEFVSAKDENIKHRTVKLTEQVTPGDAKQRAGPPPLKQQKLDFGAKPVSGGELKKLVGQFVVEEMLPLNTVDSPSFRAIINKIPTTVNAALPHRTAFSSYLEEEYALMERNLKAALNDVDFVSTTADIWTANNRSYMGVTLHWISRSTLERNKAALACRRIRGRHTYDVIGAEIENIHSSYGLLNKVVATVTDNGSNFVKAFNVYQPVTESDDETEEGESTPTNDDLGVKSFKDKEYQFLHEYCTAMKPLSAALDILQGDCPYGTLLPKLEVLMQKTLDVKDALSRMTAGLPDAIVQAIQTRFGSVLDDKDALLAAVSCPKFKLRWLRDAGRRERVKELLIAECRRATTDTAQSSASVPSATTSASQGEMDFFTFEAEP
ncbi:hypothetical protein F2P79_006315 [Pimephales promelas]|nr:hypothetical protein F2P79_006315 [Pimephales promelas]